MVFPVVGGNQSSGDIITNSLRFDGSSSQLQRTPSSEGNKRTFTWSTWVKRCGEDSDFFIGGGTSGSVYVGIGFQSDQLKYYDQSSGVLANKQTNAKFRDPSAWYHIVAAVDTTDGTAANRIKLYVNGEQQTSFTTNVIPSQNQDLYFGQDNIFSIGTIHYTAGNVDYYNGYFDTDDFQYYGQRYGLTPELQNINGSFVLDLEAGKIYLDAAFQENNFITLTYISDGLGDNGNFDNVLVPKLAEDAVYASILYNLSKVRSAAAGAAGLYKKEASAKMRNAKIRLSNMKVSEMAKVLRNKAKWIKH